MKPENQLAAEPTEAASVPDLSRRDILSAATVACAGTALSACGNMDTTPMPMPMGQCSGSPTGPVIVSGTDAAAIAVGQAKRIEYGMDVVKPAFLLYRDANGYLALKDVCTHAGCNVAYSPGGTQYKCGCHGSAFKLDGTVANGPAMMPLQTLSLCRRSDGALIVDPYKVGGTNTSRVT